MNLIDILILIIFAGFIIFGAYKGFLMSILSLGSLIVSCLASLLFYPLLSRSLLGSNLFQTIINYTDGAQRISDIASVNLPVAQAAPGKIVSLVQEASLPNSIGNLLQQNLTEQAFADQGLTTMAEYFNQTIGIVVLNVACFLFLFIIIRAALSLAQNGVHFVIRLPMLKQHDRLLGSCFGAMQAFLFLFILFLLVPVVLTLLPFDAVSGAVKSSLLGNFFYESNFVMPFIVSIP
ncbi:MAG: CvpA family protein [Christensenellales bacterium]